METNKAKSSPEFELVKEISDNVWIAVERGDTSGQKYLARRIHEYDALYDDTVDSKLRKETASLYKLMYELEQVTAVSRILNHENIISIVGQIARTPLTEEHPASVAVSEDFVVTDHCDASNLSAIFRANAQKESCYYLPESLCWHVIRSLTRAVTWLHDGKRMFCDECVASCNEPQTIDEGQDWQTILHRAIEPDNIWFQRPLGKETYGLCKLGNFSHAAVASHFIRQYPDDEGFDPTVMLSGKAIVQGRGFARLRHLRVLHGEQVLVNPDDMDLDTKPYTLGDELRSIGSVVFTMMTGQALNFKCQTCGCNHVTTCWAYKAERSCMMDLARAAEGCDCPRGGCKHVQGRDCDHTMPEGKPCEHEFCQEDAINTDKYLAYSRYSTPLLDAVQRLLRCAPMERFVRQHALPAMAWVEAEYVEKCYHNWRGHFAEADAYVDVEHGDEVKEMLKRTKRAQNTTKRKQRNQNHEKEAL